jgi:hypothetical protein
MEHLKNSLPEQLNLRLKAFGNVPVDEGTRLRSCTFMVSISSSSQFLAAGAGDCYAICRGRGRSNSEQIPDRLADRRREGQPQISGAVAVKGPTGIEVSVGGYHALTVPNPDTAYLCSDGAYLAYFSAHHKNPNAVDTAAWPDIVSLMLDHQRIGSVTNDDISVVRLKFA